MIEKPDTRLSLDKRAAYRITLQGLLDASWADELGENITIEHIRRADAAPTTIIQGEVADQAALSGVLNLVYSLGYPLISVDYLGKDR